MASFQQRQNYVPAENKTFLCIFCDTTGSMGSWITALNKMIPQFIRISALTGAFEKIMIVSYKDYDADAKNVVTSTGWLDPFDQQLIDFSKLLRATGGGGHPEAVKTGIYHILEQIPSGLDKQKDKVFILQLTDAPAHDESDGLDTEGHKELEKLGKVKFDWLAIIDEIKKLPISFNVYTTCTSYKPYGAITSGTDGFLVQAERDLEKGILDVFNGWFGADESLTFQSYTFVRNGDAAKKDKNEVEMIRAHTLALTTTTIVQEKLSNALGSVLLRLDIEESYRNTVFKLLEQIIEDDVLTLTANKIFGRVWRKICTMRKDPRRDELIMLIENAKKKLTEGARGKFDAWLKESYNMIEEIKGELEDLVTEEKIDLCGCIEYMRDVDDISEPADLVQLLRGLGNKDQSYIKNAFARMTVNAEKTYNVSMMTTALPLKMSSARIFSLIMHLVAPGTKFNGRRNQAILAMLALNTVLDSQAKEFLHKFKGKWLNWKVGDDGKAEIPENFQVKFLYLCKQHREYLLDEEYTKIERLTKMTLCNRIPEMAVTILHENITSMDGVRPDHHLTCQGCQKSRPLSLVIAGGMQCGYCIAEAEPGTVQTPDETYMVRCSKCKAFYSRDRSIHVMGKAQCHECFNGGTPSHVQCQQCQHPFVTYNGLPDSTCKPCSLGHKKLAPTFKDHSVTVRQVLEEHPALVNQLIGFTHVKGVTNLLEMDAKLEECEAVDVEAVKAMTIVYNNKVVENFSEVVDKIVQVIQSHQIQPSSCDLCCENKHRSELGRACGRAGCELMVCNDCGGQWYGENKVGHVINLRHCQCMFCARKPSSKVIARWWDPAATALMRDLPTDMDAAKYYAWCVRCSKAKVCADRACGAGQAPRFTNFECEECQVERAEAERLLQTIQENNESLDKYDQIRCCPACELPTIRYAGCNHITCSCNAHWCFECGGQFDEAEIYSHMNTEHGRIYADETPYFANNEDEE